MSSVYSAHRSNEHKQVDLDLYQYERSIVYLRNCITFEGLHQIGSLFFLMNSFLSGKICTEKYFRKERRRKKTRNNLYEYMAKQFLPAGKL